MLVDAADYKLVRQGDKYARLDRWNKPTGQLMTAKEIGLIPARYHVEVGRVVDGRWRGTPWNVYQHRQKRAIPSSAYSAGNRQQYGKTSIPAGAYKA